MPLNQGIGNNTNMWESNRPAAAPYALNQIIPFISNYDPLNQFNNVTYKFTAKSRGYYVIYFSSIDSP